ncbi:hypothetical protein LSCM1_03580 [Leishmania martiniquensis]|uniref:Uncharacterized protein n=1 Tax=Leishmania martiniquensis TaxID=1580590 RepID=A0A836KLY7_9TRYP|nr:hypothetical protein LSCM1_03580 [Leishmania martiniquensis]
MTGGARGQLQAMSLRATRLIDVDEAVRILQEACQRRISADTLAQLMDSAQHLASHCTPALFSSVLEACDATTEVEAAPKKLTMLNAAWKLLLTIASQGGVEPGYYGAAVAHMVEQLHWGVLTHDWSDKKRVRLAAFFASHVVSAVRAHPQLLLPCTPDATAVISQLVRLYFAVCVTVATSTQDAVAVSLLYDSIVVRFHNIFNCFGSAAAAAATVSAHSGELDVEEACGADEGNEGDAASSPCGEVTLGDSAAIPSQLRCRSPASVLEELLIQCVSTEAAREVEEAAGGGVAARMAIATAAFSLYLHVVRGALDAATPPAAGTSADSVKQASDSGRRGAEGDEAAAFAPAPSSPRLAPLATQELVMKSLMWWTHSQTEDGQVHAPRTRASLLRAEVLTWAVALPPDVLCCSEALDASGAAPPVSLRALWTDTLATVWHQWLRRMCEAPKESGEACRSGAAERLRASTSCGAEAVKPAAALRTPKARGGKAEPAVVVVCSARFASLLLSSVAGTLPSSPAALMVLEAWAQLFLRAEEAATDFASAIPSPDTLCTSGGAVTIAHALLRVLADLRCGAAALVEGLLRLQRCHSQDGRYRAGPEQAAAFGSTHALAAIPLRWICAAVSLLAYGEAMLGVLSPCAGATAQFECAGEAEVATAARVVAHLTEVMRAHMTPHLCGSKVSETAADTEARAVTDATMQLRELLLSVQQNESASGVEKTPASAKPTRRTQTALLLLGVPRAWSALSTAVSQHRPTAPANANGADTAERCGLELKTALLSLAPLLASLTHTLQSLGCEPGLSVASEEAEIPSYRPCTRVARWVAARLLDEVAVVPLTDSSEDAVLVACVRRWTDLAFASGACAAREGSATVRHDDPVALADAAAALLHIMEECTTLSLEKLRLPEESAHSLMELLKGDDRGSSGEKDGVGDDDDCGARCPSWTAVRGREAAEWRETEKWFLNRRLAAEESEQAGESAPAPVLTEALRATPSYMDAMAPPSSEEDLRRGLSYCEAVLQHLQERDLALLDNTGNQSKRHRSEGSDAPQAAVSTLLQSVERIQELSRSLLLRAGCASDAGTHGTTAASGIVPLPPPPHVTPPKAAAPAGSEGGAGSVDPVFTLTDPKPVGSRRVPSYAEVIDVE